ncbi:MAG: class I SAM-dependent methyltransferase [Rhodobacteraceae bacterium]|nr:class I SAM-dependent methyltransferase [Paracoccaceae bacterium]
MPDPNLDSAYALDGDDDIRRLYADWAETYDSGFAVDMDFDLPQKMAGAFANAGGGGPVLDFGCGTGLLGAQLAARGIGPIDGVDLSAEMLGVAARKGAYRDLIEGNLLDGLSLPEGRWAGITSSGTFTLGHVGPEALDALLPLAAPGALFALSINRAHFEAAGFAAKFDGIADRITGLELPEMRYYGKNATGEHKNDTGYIALFRKV